MWINVWSAGKTVRSLVNRCQPERFRDEYHTHYKALYKCPLNFTLLYFTQPLHSSYHKGSNDPHITGHPLSEHHKMAVIGTYNGEKNHRKNFVYEYVYTYI